MSVIDEALRANTAFAERFRAGGLAMPPARKLAILACMDARLDPAQMLGLNLGDAHVIRNAGAIVTEDALRSLLISHYLLGTQELMIVGHTDCGMLTFKDHELSGRLRSSTGANAVAPAVFHAFTDPEDNVRSQIEKLRSHPWVPKGLPVRGFIYDVKTGRLREVGAAAARTA